MKLKKENIRYGMTNKEMINKKSELIYQFKKVAKFDIVIFLNKINNYLAKTKNEC